MTNAKLDPGNFDDSASKLRDATKIHPLEIRQSGNLIINIQLNESSMFCAYGISIDSCW